MITKVQANSHGKLVDLTQMYRAFWQVFGFDSAGCRESLHAIAQKLSLFANIWLHCHSFSVMHGDGAASFSRVAMYVVNE